MYHGLQPSVNGDWLSPWERATFDPYRIDIPESISKKFVSGDYVDDPYSFVKFGAHPSTGASERIGEI